MANLVDGLRRLWAFLTRPTQKSARANRYRIELYRGFASDTQAAVSGRVFRHLFVNPARSDSPHQNFKAFLHRMLCWGGADLHLKATLGNHEQRVTTDGDGYFHVHWSGLSLPSGTEMWHLVAVDLLDSQCLSLARAPGAVYALSERSEFVVISDIDDTVMMTDVSNKIVMMWRLFFTRAERRMAFSGVADFYRALHNGRSGNARNPMIYVSRAPWSIYDVLTSFFENQEIPGGAILLLREWGLTLQSPLPRRAKDHKRVLVNRVMSLYGDRKIVLIGDSGQHDPELYSEFVERFGERIVAVYIRDVNGEGTRRKAIHGLAKQIETQGSTMIVTSDTVEMARHAASIGLISDAALQEIQSKASAE